MTKKGRANLRKQKIGRKTVGMPSEGNAKAETRVGNTFRRLQKLHNIPGKPLHPPEFLHPHPPGNENVAVWPSGQKLLVGCVIKAVHPFNPWPQKREN